jgi:hypothetical protein
VRSETVQRTEAPSAPGLDRLELAVARLLQAHDEWKRRAEVAEERVRELESAVHEMAEGRMDPVAMAAEVRQLEARNRKLRKRMSAAQETVERILARLQFAEEER